jgi:hypothetical protein
VEHGDVVRVAEASRIERDVDVEAGAVVLADDVVVGLAQVRPEAAVLIAMGGEVENARVVKELLLSGLT